MTLVIGNMDETALRFNMDDGLTYDFLGNKEINIKSPKGKKMTFTAMLATLSCGLKLPPLLIFKSTNPIANSLRKKYLGRVLIYSNSNSWCNETIMNEWLTLLWLNLNINPTDKLLLIMDRFAAHTKQEIQDKIKSGKCEIRYIPPGATGLMQPLDTHINKPLKDKIRKKFNDWYICEGIKEKNKDSKGNINAPSADLVIKWTLDA